MTTTTPKRLTERVAETEKGLDCRLCREIREKYDGFGPSHNGSRRCESGSIASGGTRAHCSCRTCF